MTTGIFGERVALSLVIAYEGRQVIDESVASKIAYWPERGIVTFQWRPGHSGGVSVTAWTMAVVREMKFSLAELPNGVAP